ncbi:hypothetical protein NEMBOFW57_002606 [Staphylotrichum longicolle]|uniref:Uncharacterized protein n=1 Tax=Staphylotrichum longicolle TaxID=669026 RepID=A0AAD4F3D0_9PEZI|nr:hypothetical protein NEMBOFW57_002606 [Staphylotrichum longicolle]
MAVAAPPPFNIVPPDVRACVEPVLSALAGAAVSTQPPTNVLPSLTPILRQRVQLMSSASTEPWIRLLTYDPAKVSQLTAIAQSGILDPHPVSGEIEVDWDSEVDRKYKRSDQETLQTLVVLKELHLFFKLLYCTGDPDAGEGWRVGEVGAVDPSTITMFSGFSDINEAEKSFQANRPTVKAWPVLNGRHVEESTNGAWSTQTIPDDDDDDDDDYWGRYDATPSRTPARTPAAKHSPAPQTLAPTSQPGIQRSQSTEAEDAYYAITPNRSPLGVPKTQPSQVDGTTTERKETNDGPVLAQPIPIKPGSSRSSVSRGSDKEAWVLTNPRPSSSASSNASETVAKLEEVAESRVQTEYGVKQHISRSIRSLFLLSRSSGIDREEFERMVRTELDVLGMVEQDI